ncbi:MAG: pyridoxal-phosphate dependent enzyme [Gemmatimonadota bacterium]|nr:pyridoxal-phosphate dependent enzyme [Gemmatimonadota bacterium]
MPLVTHADVQAARERIAGRVYRTPVVRSRNLSALLGVDLYLKLEPMQKTGSFKIRGALNRVALLTDAEKARGVITLSAGNHAQALAWAAASAGVGCVVVMPATAVRGKMEATRAYGGEVIQTSADLMETVEAVRAERGLTLVHPFDDAAIIAGAGTATDEAFDDVPGADAVVVGVGGGGLISGAAVVSRARRPSARIIGVEPEGASAMRQSLDAGRPGRLATPPPTVADGLAAPFAGALTFAHVRDLGVEVHVVPDKAIVDAMWLLMERVKVVAEPAAAAGLAALLAGLPEPLPRDAKVVYLVSGGNVDRERLQALG